MAGDATSMVVLRRDNGNLVVKQPITYILYRVARDCEETVV